MTLVHASFPRRHGRLRAGLTLRLRCALALVLVPMTQGLAQDQAGALARKEELPRAERMRIVEAMDAFTRKHFAHWSAISSTSYDSLVTAFRVSAERADDRRAFSLAALAFTAGLRNGHTEFRDQWLLDAEGQPLWLWVWPEAGGWLVTSTEIPGLAKGDIIEQVDGVGVDEVYARLRPYLAASGERMRRYMVTHVEPLWPHAGQLTLSDGRILPFTRGVPNVAAVSASRASRPLVPHRWIVPDSIAYVRIARFAPGAYEDSAVALVRRHYLDAPALIVDVRGNGGGSTPRRLMALLQGTRAGRPLALERTTIAADRFRFLGALRRGGGGASYRGALVILVDHGCASACEDFLAPLADGKEALVIGDTTWGTSGQPQVLDLGHGMTYQVSARRYRLANGAPFEGVGIPPHLVVPLSAAALREGRDLPLERALSELRVRR